MSNPESSSSPVPNGDRDIGHVMTESQWAAVQAAREAHLASLASLETKQ
jgi:hypothetical protein